MLMFPLDIFQCC